MSDMELYSLLRHYQEQLQTNTLSAREREHLVYLYILSRDESGLSEDEIDMQSLVESCSIGLYIRHLLTSANAQDI